MIHRLVRVSVGAVWDCACHVRIAAVANVKHEVGSGLEGAAASEARVFFVSWTLIARVAVVVIVAVDAASCLLA